MIFCHKTNFSDLLMQIRYEKTGISHICDIILSYQCWKSKYIFLLFAATQENYERPTSTRPDPVKPESPLGLGDKLKIGSLTPSMAGLGNMFRKASSFLGFSNTDSLKPPPLDGEIIYSKNNVCVHPPAPLSLDVEHHPGYLTIRSQNDSVSYCLFFHVQNLNNPEQKFWKMYLI